MTKRKIVGVFCEQKLAPKSSFDPRSFRWKKSGRAWLLIGCPKKKWSKGKTICRGGTRAYVILRPARKNKRCWHGTRVVRKG